MKDISWSRWRQAQINEKRFWDTWIDPACSEEDFMPGTHADTWYNHFKEELQDLGQVAVEVGSGPRGLTYYHQAPWTVWIDPLLHHFVTRGYIYIPMR